MATSVYHCFSEAPCCIGGLTKMFDPNFVDRFRAEILCVLKNDVVYKWFSYSILRFTYCDMMRPSRKVRQ